VSGRLDVRVFPLAAVRLGPLLPFPGVADSHRDVESLWDADHGAVLRACLDMVDAIPEGRQGHQDLMALAVEKLAVRELRLADAVRDHLVPASAESLGRLALVGFVERWAQQRAAAAPYKRDVARSAG
jgi:hypothetical protein